MWLFKLYIKLYWIYGRDRQRDLELTIHDHITYKYDLWDRYQPKRKNKNKNKYVPPLDMSSKSLR